MMNLSQWIHDYSLVIVPLLVGGMGTGLIWVITDRAKVEVRIVRLEDAQIGFSKQLDAIAVDIREIRRFIEASLAGTKR